MGAYAVRRAGRRARQRTRDEFEPKIAALQDRIKELEQLNLNARFAELERQLDARQAGRDASKRGAKGEKGERGARGERGVPGARGPKGEPGLPAPPITAWKIDRERYRAVPFYSDGKPGPAIELRDFFAQFLNETSWSK